MCPGRPRPQFHSLFHTIYICTDPQRAPEKAVYWFSVLTFLPDAFMFLDAWGQFSYGLGGALSFMSRKGHNAVIKNQNPQEKNIVSF